MTCLLTATEQRTTVTNLGIVKKIIIIMCSKTKSERERERLVAKGKIH